MQLTINLARLKQYAAQHLNLTDEMLDVANLIKLGSETWRQYLAAWAASAQEPLNTQLAHLGYYLATIMVNTQYLPYAVDFTPLENVAQMVAKVAKARVEIAEFIA